MHRRVSGSRAVSRRGLAALLVLLWAGVGMLWLVGPAGASTSATRTAKLAVTGVIVDNCPVSAGGTTIYVKPGDTVQFASTLAGITVGSLQYNGAPLGLDSSKVAGLNEDLQVAGETSGGKQVTRKLTPTQNYSKPFASEGRYGFTYTATSVQLASALQLSNLPVLGGVVKSITQVPLKAGAPGVAAGAKLTWSGQVIVSKYANNCGLSVQLPSVGVSASVTGVGNLPTISLPGATLPSLPLPSQIPTIKITGPGGSSSTRPSAPATKSTQQGEHVDYTPHGSGVAATTVPTGYGNGSGRTGAANGGVGPEITASAGQGSAVLAGAGYTPSSTSRALDLSTPNERGSGSRMNIVWVIAAVATLSAGVVAYARQFLAN